MTNAKLSSQLKLPLPILNNLKVDSSLKVETCPDSYMKKIWTLSGMQNISSVLVCGTYWLSPSITGYFYINWVSFTKLERCHTCYPMWHHCDTDLTSL